MRQTKTQKTALPLLPLVLDGVADELTEMLVQEGVPFCNHAQSPLAGRFVLFDSHCRGRRPTSTGQAWIDVARLCNADTDDPMAMLADRRASRHQWQVGPLTLVEEIARVDRRAVRRRFIGRLRGAIEELGGIWLTVSPYPFPYRSAFNFRIDHDEFDQHDFDATMRAIRGHEGWTSHFVNAAGHESADSAWDRLRGLDVGSHGYRHHVYRTVEENVQNIARGIEMLRRQGIEPRGFVAPAGRFRPELQAAIKELNISHSGEFGLAYDELPFRLSNDGPLQVPIHPVCLGLFLEAVERQSPGSRAMLGARRRHAAATAADYYDKLIHDRARAAEPLFLYGHPEGRLGRYPGVLRRVLQSVDSLATVWKTTQSDWVNWWQTRREIHLKVVEENGSFMVTAEPFPDGWDFAVEFWRHPHVALMPLEKSGIRFSPSALAYENRQRRQLTRPVRIDRAEGLKSHLRRALDWERVTPVDEIHTTGWRNRIKKTLRRWMDQ